MAYARRFKSTGFASKGRRVRSSVAASKAARGAALRRKRDRVQPGFTRVGGFYGRYSGAAGEKKFYDQTLSGGIDSTGTNEISLVTIPQGVTESTRVGRKCTVTDINLRGYVQWAGASLAAVQTVAQVRIVVCQDTQTNGAACAWTDVFNANSVNAHRNLANTQRFRILKDWILTPSNFAATTTDNWATAANTVLLSPNTKLKFNMKCQIPLEFSSTTGAITELRSNNLCIMAISNSGDDTNNVVLACRVRFTDN